MDREAHQARTTSEDGAGEQHERQPASLALTVLCHPDPGRIGERAVLPWRPGACLAFSRHAPSFSRGAASGSEGGEPAPLGDRGVSRRPLRIHLEVDRLRLESDEPLPYLVGGRALGPRSRVLLSALGDGCALRCGRRVLVWVEAKAEPESAWRGEGPLRGHSDASIRLARRIETLAGHRFSVELRGEPDTGAEAAARALHDRGARPDGPWVTLYPARLETTDDVGAAIRGAHARARGGTLFIHDADRLSQAAQVALLHTLELAEHSDDADAPRLITSTTTALELHAGSGRFLAALAYRLAVVHVELPPLRTRRVDIAPLFVDALRVRLDELGRLDRLSVQPPWLTPPIVEALLRHGWPGNLRELDNLALEVALGADAHDSATLPPGWSPVTPSTADVADAWTVGIDDRAWSVDPAALKDALRRHGWRARQTADELGVSRNTVYSMMGRLGIRRPGDLSAAEIAAAVEAVGSADVERVAARLEVSSRGLALRLGALGISLDE